MVAARRLASSLLGEKLIRLVLISILDFAGQNR